ncbi:MAG: phosphoribosyltransferase, partial [Armatimonadaceae bacterium]
LAYRDRSDVLVAGLPRGGVPVAARVARALRAPLDIWVVRKIGAPGNEELAIGAVASGGVVVRNDDVIGLLGISEAEFSARAAQQQAEVARRDRLWRGDAAGPDVNGRTVIVVDDGMATGATALSAAAALRQSGASTVVVAAPVASLEAVRRLRDAGIPSVFVFAPDDFDAVGKWFVDFRPVEDDCVSLLLHPEGKARPRSGMGDWKEVLDEPQGIGMLFGHGAGGHPRAPR